MVEILLIISIVLTMTMYIFFDIKKVGMKYRNTFQILFILVTIWSLGLLLQKTIGKFVNPYYFDCISYIGACLTPVVLLRLAFVFSSYKVNSKFNNFYIIPLLSILLVWTNELHHFFYKVYSTNLDSTVFGGYFIVHSIYSYALIIISMLILIRTSFINSGFLSKQTMLIILASLIPLMINLLGYISIVKISIYITPILFAISSMLIALAIMKYKALNITPIAFRTVIDTMSDAFIVISDDGTIVDNNLTFENTFKDILKANKDENLFEMIEQSNLLDLKNLKVHISETRKRKKIINEEYHITSGDFDKYFQVDIHPIKAKQTTEYVGTLLLFKDITEHINDIKIIQDKQEVIVKQGQLVSIGELAGGVAHDINTPISAIKTGIQLLQEMYVPRDDTEKDLLFRMSNCTEKIIKIVNSMRNQIRNLGSDQMINFKVSEVINDVKIISYNEFQKSGCQLIINIEDDLSVYGDPTKLGQVFTNLFINSIQAYNEKKGKIEVTVYKAPSDKVMVKVTDFAGGIPEKMKDFVFKNILTTKGTKGTGLGLYLAYSVIKGEFSGDITFESFEGEGTTFYILLNRSKKSVVKVNGNEGLPNNEPAKVSETHINNEKQVNNEIQN